MDGLFYEDIVHHSLRNILASGQSFPAVVAEGAWSATNESSENNKLTFNLLAALNSSELKNGYGEIGISDGSRVPGTQAITMQVR